MMQHDTITSPTHGVDGFDRAALAAGPDGLDLAVTELEALEAPGFWDTAAGVGAGTVIGYGVVWGAVAFT
ncbi:daptide-type RiPP [Patulibacter sp. NPDC049589]|uniref:daptide-type RiPP n=1 Tax=Patulibacter sp. NPDC049589 TaxID=3154731 RepID=UPI0034485A5D